MKAVRFFEPHLVIKELILLPGGEWTPQSHAWTIFQVSRGFGYWTNSSATQELSCRSLLLVSPQAQGCARASQLAELVLRYFVIDPARLTGLFSLGEQHLLAEAGARLRLSPRFFTASEDLSSRFSRICAEQAPNEATLRLNLAQVFIDALRAELSAGNAGPGDRAGARRRLTEFLRTTPEFELLSVSLPELARTACCTPRHLSRLFREIAGIPFRQKQTELRLSRARELLANSQARVLDVAMESGYGSLSLFNLLFRKRFGVSPGRWRKQLLAKTPRRRTTVRYSMP